MRKELKKIEQEKVDDWNAKHKVGQRVVLTKDDGRKIRMKTIGKAELLNGHTAIVPLSGRSVCYLVERTKAVSIFFLLYEKPVKWHEKAVAMLKRFAKKIEELNETEFGIMANPVDSIKKAVEEYIRVGVKSRLFTDASQFELTETNPNRLELVVHKCPYLKSCEALLKEGISLSDLTCARIGAFRASVLHLADIDCNYEVTAFAVDETCRGTIERK